MAESTRWWHNWPYSTLLFPDLARLPTGKPREAAIDFLRMETPFESRTQRLSLRVFEIAAIPFAGTCSYLFHRLGTPTWTLVAFLLLCLVVFVSAARALPAFIARKGLNLSLSRQIATGAFRICVDCGCMLSKAGARRCPGCGAPIPKALLLPDAEKPFKLT